MTLSSPGQANALLTVRNSIRISQPRVKGLKGGREVSVHTNISNVFKDKTNQCLLT